MRWVAFMPLRGGSRSIPDKNIRLIAGRPLFSWSLAEAIKSGCFDDVYVATDSPAIRTAVEEYFPGVVNVLDRSDATCTDTAATELAMIEFQAQVPFDVMCLVQATSPFTRAADFQAAQRQFEAEKLDSLLTVAPLKRFLWSRPGTPVNYDPANRPRRQDFAGQLVENGAFYFTRAEILKEQHCRLGSNIGLYEMSAETLVEIDEPVDWVTAEQLLLAERSSPVYPGASIQGLVLDVDGTLTDGGMYYSSDGEAMKKFDTRDANGLQRLRDSGVAVAVITAENSDVVTARMRKLNINEYYPGAKQKLPVLEKIAGKWNIPLENLAYMGDDIGDRECLQRVGFSICPADAVPVIRRLVDYISSSCGGSGAVREVCDLIIKLNAKEV